MSVLLWLYPRSWRRRYGAEMEALLEQMRGRRRLGLALDLVRGAADAHLNPRRPRRRRLRRLAAPFGLLAAALASALVAAAAGNGQTLAAALLGGLWLAVALAWRWLGSRTLFLFAAVVAARYPADRILALAVAHLEAPALPYRVGAGVLEATLGGAVAVLLLRRTRLRWPVAFAAGCLLELALGIPPGVWPALAALEPVRAVLWAAGLAWLARRRRPRPWHEPPEGEVSMRAGRRKCATTGARGTKCRSIVTLLLSVSASGQHYRHFRTGCSGRAPSRGSGRRSGRGSGRTATARRGCGRPA